jgi:glycosyltransferase involved in cell wall biosynthesis
VRLLLAGKPLDVQYTESLRTLATDLGIVERVHFLGGVSDIPALLAESDVFVLPSEREACPVALLEAMSCGVPCIVSDIPGTRDVIEDGATGLFFRTGDHNGMAAALRRIANNKEQFAEMARAARKRILHNYTIDREVRQYEQMYSEVLN